MGKKRVQWYQDKTKITATKVKSMTRTVKYTWIDYKWRLRQEKRQVAYLLDCYMMTWMNICWARQRVHTKLSVDIWWSLESALSAVLEAVLAYSHVFSSTLPVVFFTCQHCSTKATFVNPTAASFRLQYSTFGVQWIAGERLILPAELGLAMWQAGRARDH